MALHVIGIRHHSPACASLVQSAIAALEPDWVLIEGPADMNERLDELLLSHTLPVAIFSYYHDDKRTHASWTPFCDYSPEWVALREGAEAGAAVRFMDLPAWTEAFAGVRNRYSDGDRRQADYVSRLCQELGVDGMDALWDHLFEQPMETEALTGRLDAYFDAVRSDDGAGDRDEAREAFMVRCVRAALAQSEREVVVVCGGYHKPAIEAAVARADRDDADASWPEVPAGAEGARHGSYLVPYTFARLDSFTGYESGMPSPAYYQSCWRYGLKAASEQMLAAIVMRLRERKQLISSADLIGALSMTEGLARMRGHAVVGRTDLLDGLASALVKDAQEVPLPWSERGTLRAGTHPVLVEVVRTMSGTQVGLLAEGTPRPPLIADVWNKLHEHKLTPEDSGRREETLDLTDPEDVERSRLLHQLALLGVPGFVRQQGPSWATDAELKESWLLWKAFEAESALIEAAAYGSTLIDAAMAKLSEKLLEASNNLEALAALLGEAVFVGLSGLTGELLELVAHQARAEPKLERLGPALGQLLGLFRHDTLLGAKGSLELGRIIEAAYDRGLWLFEGIQGQNLPADQGHLKAAMALRDTARFTADILDVSVERATRVMLRRSTDLEAPAAIRGAALGSLWSMDYFDDAHEAVKHALTVIRASSHPKVMGDFLAGLFALAREEVMAVEIDQGGEVDGAAAGGPLLAAIDAALGMMENDDFLVAVPALRNAFSFFPPVEKDRIAKAILVRHGEATADSRAFRKLEVPPEVMMAAQALEAEVTKKLLAHGLISTGDEEVAS